ncbi:MAG: DNA polymerase III subunit delta [Gammaproteobacteria bacterium]|nr:MAG: DNA polymerase III subunit delta [Gammaproteobacteria bacterium]
MRLDPARLPALLSRGELPPIWLISGDEPLQLLECADAVREAARGQGYQERAVLTVEPGFDWGSLPAEGQVRSLFASRRLIELRLGERKPGREGAAVLKAWAEAPPADNLLLITCGRLDRKALSSAWCRAIDRAGALVQVWPVPPQRLPGWIGRRATALGLKLDAAACALIAERVEGNLLAARQELELLALLLDGGEADVEAVRRCVGDSARFDVFELVDAALSGDAARVARVHAGLRAEGLEPVILAWALNRELRALCRIAAGLGGGRPQAELFRENGIWSSRQQLVGAALRRHDPPMLRHMLRAAGELERQVKGAAPGDPWEHALAIAMALAGRPLRAVA